MKTSFVFGLLSLMLTSGFAATSALADVQKPIWQCGVEFAAKGGGVQVIVGHFKLKGKGELKCVDIAGHEERIPVSVTFGGHPLAPNLSIGKFYTKGVATGEGYAASPTDLLGKYLAGSANGAAVIGVGATTSFHLKENAITLNVSFQEVEGLGVQFGIDTMELARL